MDKVSTQNYSCISCISWMYNWYYTNKKLSLRNDFLKIGLLGILFIPYFIFTLPGCFLEGSFCNRQKKLKIALSIVGYFLMIVAGCMIAPVLAYLELIPSVTYFNVAIFIGKVWDVFAVIGILLMLVSAISDSIEDVWNMRFKKLYVRIGFRVRPIFRNTIA